MPPHSKRTKLVTYEDVRKLCDKDAIFWEFACIDSNSLSEDFMREFSDVLDWYTASMFQQMSESFMREFSDKLYWPFISQAQNNLSKEFINDFYDKLDIDVLKERGLIS